MERSGISLVAISYDTPEVLSAFAGKAGIRFPLLSDRDSKVIDAFGLRNKEVKAGSRQDGIPYPGTIVIGADGKIRGKLFYTVRKRHSPQELIELVNNPRTEPEP